MPRAQQPAHTCAWPRTKGDAPYGMGLLRSLAKTLHDYVTSSPESSRLVSQADPFFDPRALRGRMHGHWRGHWRGKESPLHKAASPVEAELSTSS